MARRVTVVAGAVGGVGWLSKVALIWENGGTNTDEGVVGLLYLVGVVGLVVAFVAAGVWLTAGRAWWLRALGAVLGLVAFGLVYAALDALLSPLAADDHWFAEEIGIVAMAVVGLLLAGWAASRGRPHPTRATSAA